MAKLRGQISDTQNAINSGQTSPKVPEILLASNCQLQRRTFDFYTILELSRSLNSVLNLKSLLNSFLNVLLSRIKANTAAVIQKESRQVKKYILTNWQNWEQMFPQGLLADHE